MKRCSQTVNVAQSEHVIVIIIIIIYYHYHYYSLQAARLASIQMSQMSEFFLEMNSCHMFLNVFCN